MSVTAETPGAPGTDRSLSPAAITQAYDTYQDLVRRIAGAVCGRWRAEDVTQEVFLNLCLHPERFDPARGSIRSYLVIQARARAIDTLRNESARSARQERASNEVSPPAVPERVLAADEAERVRNAIRLLPAEEREAIATAFYGHLSYQAAAAALGKPEGTVKSRIRTGLRRLERNLTDV